MTTGAAVGFSLTVLALVVFLVVSWWQLRRVDRITVDEGAGQGTGTGSRQASGGEGDG